MFSLFIFRFAQQLSYVRSRAAASLPERLAPPHRPSLLRSWQPARPQVHARAHLLHPRRRGEATRRSSRACSSSRTRRLSTWCPSPRSLPAVHARRFNISRRSRLSSAVKVIVSSAHERVPASRKDRDFLPEAPDRRLEGIMCRISVQVTTRIPSTPQDQLTRCCSGT